MKSVTRDAYSLGNAQLAAGTNAGTFKTQAAVNYNIDGKVYSKAITDNLAVSAGTAMGTLTQSCFFVWIDAAGTVTTTQGAVVPVPGATGYTAGAWELPHHPSRALIGAIKVVLASTATFTPGTTAFGASNVTSTFINFADDYSTPITY